MSRMIKTWPYTPAFKDTVGIDVAHVSDIRLPQVAINTVHLHPNMLENLITNFEVTCSADENTPGVTLKLCTRDNSGFIVDNEGAELTVDEIEFVDAIYNSVVKGNTSKDSEFVQHAIQDLIQLYAFAKLKKDIFVKNVLYPGFGVIRSEESIIGTVEGIEFSGKESVTLYNCVGSANLKKVERCNIVFISHGYSFCINSFNDVEIIEETDIFCTQKLLNIDDCFRYSFPLAPSEYESLSKLEENSERFVEERICLISNDSEEQTDEFADIEL